MTLVETYDGETETEFRSAVDDLLATVAAPPRRGWWHPYEAGSFLPSTPLRRDALSGKRIQKRLRFFLGRYRDARMHALKFFDTRFCDFGVYCAQRLQCLASIQMCKSNIGHVGVADYKHLDQWKISKDGHVVI
jgi:hypothetical protein